MTKKEWFHLTNTGNLTQLHINQWLSEGNSIDVQNMWGWTALMDVCYSGHYDIARLLIEKGADINHQNKDGNTALMWACEKGYYEITCLLLDKGADVNHQNDYNMTALMYVCYRGYYELNNSLQITQLLLENGGNPYLLDNRSKSAYDLLLSKEANGLGNKQIKNLILKYHPNIINIKTIIIKRYINKQNNKVLSIKRINIPLNKLI